MKVTIRHLSELTGYSPATVSNALNKKKGVNSQTADKIYKAAKEAGYLMGTSQRKITFLMYKSNGLITEDTPFFSMMLDGFQSECRRWGYEMVISYVDRRDHDFEQQIQQIINDETAIVALLGAEMMDEDFKWFINAKCLLLTLDYWHDEMDFSGVIINNTDSARMAVNYLIGRGHRNIGYLRGDFRIKAFRLRAVGYQLALASGGILYDRNTTITLQTTMDGAYHDMLEYLKTDRDMPTAFFADNDMIALGAMKALQEKGYRIPEDISLVGFDDLPFCEIASPRLTSLRVPKQEMGQLAVRQLIDMIENGTLVKTKTQVCAQFVERDSVKTI